MRFHPVRLRLLPLAVGAILIATAVPIALRAPVVEFGNFALGDFCANLLLFMPFGAALRHRPVALTVVAAAAFSATIEISQIWSIGRFASMYDVLANTLGALIAIPLSRVAERRGLLDAQGFRAGAWIMIGLMLVTVAVVAVWQIPHASSAVAGWDGSYPLQLGNEYTGDREWHGTIVALGIWPKTLTPREIHGESSAHFRANGAIYATRRPLVFTGGPAVRLPDSAARTFVTAATHANAFTIVARIRTADVEQKGPARILSFSIDPFHRNVDLGQQESKLAFRVRTSVSGPNGNDAYAKSVPILKAGKDTVIVASYDGGNSRIYVDGVLVARMNLAARDCPWPALCDAGVPGVWAGMAAIVTLLAISLFGWRGRYAIWLAAALAIGVVLALGTLHPDPVHRAWEGWTPMFIILGVATMVLSVRYPVGSAVDGK